VARFLIEAPHTSEDCTDALDSIMAFSEHLLGRFDWGCKAGKHVGWAVLEAQDEGTARMLLPTSIRHEARATLLNKFSIEDVKSFHAEQKQT
jgi:hypothetical protein